MKNTLLGFKLPITTKKQILEKIKKNIIARQEFQHVVSLNPENMIIALADRKFRNIVTEAQMTIIDGAGVIWAAHMLNIPVGERITGADLMQELLDIGGQMSSTVVLIGGKEKLANKIAKCYQNHYPKARYLGIEGIQNIQQPLDEEEEYITSIVRTTKPSLVFVSFGSPAQELWIDRHKDLFQGMTVIGVGGAFDFISGNITRAPSFIRGVGMEWFYRLVKEPWRWRRQLRLVQFIMLVLQQKFGVYHGQ